MKDEEGESKTSAMESSLTGSGRRTGHEITQLEERCLHFVCVLSRTRRDYYIVLLSHTPCISHRDGKHKVSTGRIPSSAGSGHSVHLRYVRPSTPARAYPFTSHLSAKGSSGWGQVSALRCRISSLRIITNLSSEFM
jgi:hypothetical protein